MKPKLVSSVSELKRTLLLMQGRMLPFLASCLAAALSIAYFTVVQSNAYQKVINGAIAGDLALVRESLIWLSLALFLVCAVTPFTSFLSNYLAKQAMAALRTRVFAHMLYLPVGRLSGSGEALSRLTNDVNRVGDIYEDHLYRVLEISLGGCFALVAMLRLNWQLSLAVVVLGLGSATLNGLYAKPLRQIGDKLQTLTAQATGSFLDIIAGTRVAKLFNLQQTVAARYGQNNRIMLATNMELATKEAERDGVDFLFGGLSFLGVLGIGAFMAAANLIDMGSVIAIFWLRGRVDEMFTDLGKALANVQGSLAGAVRVCEVLEQQPEEINDMVYQVAPAQEASHQLTVQGLSLSFAERRVLEEVDLHVPVGATVAIVGYSGAGKTTLLKAIMGLCQPHSGRVILASDEHQTQPLSLASLRSNIAYVSQDVFLFNCSVEDNIRLGKPEASSAEVRRAAELAGAHDFIMELPEGYATRLGERGARLSGGQRQRLAIARAFIKDAPLLLLDEATAALDSESEAQVQAALAELMQGRTTLVIAHRLSTVVNADTIYVMEEGRFVAQGTHASLLEADGPYREMYYAQFAARAGRAAAS